MELFSKLFNKNNKEISFSINLNINDNFDPEEYSRYNEERKKEFMDKYDLAIECLKKANELYPYSFYAYQRNNYERLVDFMILAKRFEAAKETHHQLDITIGSRLDELKKLQLYAEESGTEAKEDYYNRVIKPSIDEEKDKEEYYWLLEKLPSIAPKSFGGYRKMKNTQSDNYKKIINEVNNKGYDLNTVTFWKLNN